MHRTASELRGVLDTFADSLSRITPLSEGERRALCGLWRQVSEHPARASLDGRGQISFITGGWGCVERAMPGRGPQIVAFLSPGDALRAGDRETAPQPLQRVCLTRVQLVDATSLLAHPAVAAQHPGLVAALLGAELRAQDMLIDHIVRLGSRDGRGGLAHLMLELEARAAWAGEISGDWFPLPVGQRTLARAMGLSIVHINHTLARLREAGLLEMEARRARVLDRTSLRALAGLEALNSPSGPPATD